MAIFVTARTFKPALRLVRQRSIGLPPLLVVLLEEQKENQQHIFPSTN
jgi:hypothetical protein